MDPTKIREKLTAAEILTRGDSTTVDKATSLITLLKGLDRRVDKKLTTLSKSLSNLKNLTEGNVIELSADNLPEETEKEKKRKKAIIFFIKSIKELKSEIERVKNELDAKSRGEQTTTETASKITARVKGPFGLLTIAAIIAVGGFVFVKGKTTQNQPPPQSTQTIVTTPTPAPISSITPTPQASPSTKAKIQVISYNGKQIPLDQLEIKTGSECTSSPQVAPHYHAKGGQFVQATDGTIIQDPGGCGFGKVTEVEVKEIETPKSTENQQTPSYTNPSLF